MNGTTHMNEQENGVGESMRFYRRDREGRWHRKTEEGSYDEVLNKRVLDRLYVLTAKSLARIE